MKINENLKKYYVDILVILIGLTVGTFLMYSSFSRAGDNLLISTKAWSDFASHIPLIRSFSLGNNFPPEYPLFPGEAIKYHFLFYAGVGIFEKIGIPIDLALNIPSIIGFTLLTFLIYLIGKTIFKSRAVGLFSIIFLIFNSSLSFIYYFKNNPITINSIWNIIELKDFQSFAPYGNGIISAFLNLNIYTNQRHLALSFGLSLILFYFLIRPIFLKKKENLKIAAIFGILLGLSFFLHLAVLLMTSIVILFMGIFFSEIRKSAIIILVIATAIAIPQYLYLTSSPGFNMTINPGYLVADKLTISNLTQFWIFNLGISLFLIPLGFIFSNRNQKKILLSFLPIFLIGNLIQFSPEIAANHKFFNYVSIITNIFCAFALYVLWKKNNLLKPIVIVFTFFMIFGGIIDFFPLYNDHKIGIKDIPSNQDILWISRNTDKNSVFLNANYLYTEPSLAGRKVLMGWPYFAWSQGYNTDKRGKLRDSLLTTSDKNFFCSQSLNNNLNYIILNSNTPKADLDLNLNFDFFESNFRTVYKNSATGTIIYSIKSGC